MAIERYKTGADMFDYSGKATLPTKMSMDQIMELDGIRAFSSAKIFMMSYFIAVLLFL